MSQDNAQSKGHSIRKIDFSLRLRRFQIPPVTNALVVGRKAPIGPRSIYKALEEMTPGRFDLLPVEHPTAEAIIILKSDLHKVPKDALIGAILRHAGPIMDETDTLDVGLEIEIQVTEEITIEE